MATARKSRKAPRMTPAQWAALRHIAADPRTMADGYAAVTLDKLVERGLVIRDRVRGTLGSASTRYTLSAKGVEVCT